MEPATGEKATHEGAMKNHLSTKLQQNSMLVNLRKVFMQMGIHFAFFFFLHLLSVGIRHKHQQTLIKHIALMKLQAKE